jgi:integrase
MDPDTDNATLSERQRGRLPTFSTEKQMLALAPLGLEYPCAIESGLYVRVGKPTKDKRVRRTWVHRWKEEVVGDDGRATKVTRRRDLGLAAKLDEGDKVLSLDDAKAEVIRARKAKATNRDDGVKAERLTVERAWSFYDIEKPTHREPTKEKDTRVYERFLAHLGPRFLDELDGPFWTRFVHELKTGTLKVGVVKSEDDGRERPVTRGPLKPDSIIGVLNAAAVLYTIGDKYRGLVGMAKGENPPRDAKSLAGAKNQREGHIPLAMLRTTWLGSDQLLSPWWRDQLRVYLLTGLRRSLLTSMRFEELDIRRKTLLISPHKKGTKRRGAKTPVNAEPIRVPLSQLALDIILARREFAPDPNGAVWYAPKPTRGRARKDATLSDPRAAWSLIEALIDKHFTPQDLRRTFATIGAEAVTDTFAVALLMLHSGAGLAQAAGLPAITVQYMNTDQAQSRMRKAAEEIAGFVQKVIRMTPAEAMRLGDPTLPEELEAALDTEPDTTPA